MKVTRTTAKGITVARKNLTQRHRDGILRGMRVTAALVSGECKMRTSAARPHPPVDTGRYKSAWSWAPLPDGARTFNTAPHAGIVELGVRPMRVPSPYRGGGRGPSPFASLVRWVERKRIGRKADAFMIAVAVQQKIHLRGIPGKFILTAPAFQQRIKRITRSEIRRSVTGGGP